MTVARKSKDPNCQVGAVIVSPDRLVLATGFNGLARGVFDNENLLADDDEKLKWICHAEINAIFNGVRTGVPVVGCSIFVNKFPCFACCNAIAQAGIKRICTQDHRYWDDDPIDGEHARKPDLLKQANIDVDAPLHPDFIHLRSFGVGGKRSAHAGKHNEASSRPTLPGILLPTNGVARPLAKASSRRTPNRRRRRNTATT